MSPSRARRRRGGTRSRPIRCSTARNFTIAARSSSRAPTSSGCAARRFAGRDAGARSAGRRLARARVYRRAGQWRRRRAVQRYADPGGDRRDRRRAPALRHDLAAADIDQRQRAEDARGQRGRRRRGRKACPGVLGIHFEGPFLSPERAGVHDPAMIRPPAPDDLDLLRAPRRGDAGDPGARARAARLYREPRARRSSGRARPFDGDLRRDPRRDRRGAERLYPSVQRDAADERARTRADRGGARSAVARFTA